ALRAAIDAVEHEPQGARADAVAHERVDDVLHQAFRDRQDGILRDQRLHQGDQAVIARRRKDVGEWLGYAAERLVDPLEQFALEARRERRAWIVQQRTDAAEAEP